MDPRDLGARFDARAINVAERIEVRGIEPRLSTHLPVTVAVGRAGCAMLFRSGAVVFFGVDALGQERFLHDLAPRIHGRFDNPEVERATIKIGGDADAVEPDALILRDATIDRLQVVAEILAKSVVLARNETEIGAAFSSIEPLAIEMKRMPRRLPWKQRELVRRIGEAMLVEHQLVDRAEVLEKPELLWDRPDLDRFYARLEDEYEIRERHHVLESKLTLVSSSVRTMLELNQSQRSINVEYYIVALIVLEVGLSLYEMFVR
ncbi:MAG TPA: RMD1 family protein [Kofleriaceae bacterium]|nr:RMD1 family protein [Kofleriaceae bacterium]